MPNMLDIFGNPEEDRLQSLAEEEQRQFAESFRASQSRKAFDAAKRENRKLLQTLQGLGVEPPEEGGEGFLSRTLDILDTGGQMVRGVAAKLADVPEFSDKGFLAAALYGDEKDLTVGDILRSKNILQGQDWPTSIARGVAGFVGDVATDPLNYLSLGTTGLAKVGGKAISTKSITTATGETTTAAKLYLDSLGKAGESLAAKVGKLGAADVERVAANPFRIIRSVLDDEKRIKALGSSATAADQLLLEANQAKLIEKGLKPLGLSADFNAKDLFQQPAIRFSSLLPGVGNKWLKIPPLNGKAAYDVPGLTAFTADVFEKLNGAAYRNNLRIGSFLDRQVLKGKDGGLFQKAIAGTIDFERKLFTGTRSALSRAARVGSPQAIENTDELRAAKAAINIDTWKEADQMAFGINPDDLNDAVTMVEEGLAQHLGANGRLAKGARNVRFDQQAFDSVLGNAVSSLNAKEAGRGDRFANLVGRIRGDFDKYRDIEQEAGVLGSAVDGYVRRIIDVSKGFDFEKEVDGFARELTRSGATFDLGRKYVTAAEAKARGLKVNTNLLDSWVQRTIAHRHAMAEKRFLERMVYEVGVPRSVYEKMHTLLASENEAEAFGAIDAFKRMGLPPDPVLARKALGDIAGLKKTSIGTILTPEHYDYLNDVVSSGRVTPELADSVLSARQGLEKTREQVRELLKARKLKGAPKVALFNEAKKLAKEGRPLRELAEMPVHNPSIAAFDEARQLGLKFDDAERQAVIASHAKYEAAQNRILGRGGESFYDRAGASEMPSRFKDFLKKHSTRMEGTEAKELLDFYDGVFPTTVARAMNEMLDTRDTLVRLKDWSKDSEVKEFAAKAASMGINYTRWAKVMTTQLYPAYHSQNLTGSFFQAAHAIPTLGSALNPVRLAENMLISKGKMSLVQEGTGRVFTGAMLDDLARNFHVKTVYGETIDLLHAQSDALIAATTKGKRPGKIKGFFQDLSTAIENVGREHTFYELIRQGNAPEDAARLTNQALIDYSRNKTPFEKNFLNHLFFFYTFPRQQTANTLHALYTKPGAITAQLHAVNGVRDMLTNSQELQDVPDFDSKMMSLRAKETFGRVIGTDAEGMPEVLSDVGVPVKDLSRLMDIRFPEKLTFGSLMEAGGESIQRTSQLLASQSNPILKMAAELMAGKNFFFDRPLSDKSIRRMPDFEQAAAMVIPYGYQRVPRGLGKAVNATVWGWMNPVDNGDGTVTVDPVKYSVLTNLVPPLARAATTVKAMSKENVPVDHKLVRALLPMKINSLDFEKSGVYDRNRQLESFFEKRGLPTSKAQVRLYQHNNPTPDEELEDEVDSVMEE